MLIFIHLPKTGGSTLRDVIHWNYDDRSYQMQHFAHIPPFIALSDEEKLKIPCIQGQFFYGIHQYIPTTDYQYTTILRHPVKRVVSQYHHITTRLKRQGKGSYKKSMDEFLDEEPFQAWTQVNLLAGGDSIDSALRRPVTNELLQEAIANIEKDFPVVGVTEKYDEGLLLMQQAFDWRRAYYKRKNTNIGYPKIDTYPEATQKRIWQMCEAEIELYEYAVKRLNTQLEAQTDAFWKELEQLKQSSQRFSRIYNILKPLQRTKLWPILRKTARQIGF